MTIESPPDRFSSGRRLLLARGVAGTILAFVGNWVPSALLAAPTVGRSTRVMLIGASIGQGWQLQGFAARMNVTNCQFEAVQAWQFDKSEALEEALARPRRKFRMTWTYLKGFFRPSPVPIDIFILKECSSYFPSDLALDQKLMEGWIQRIKSSGKIAWLATVVPVTRGRSERDPGKLKALLAFNDWIRAYAKKNSVPLLDLEVALRTDPQNRFLKDEFDVGDGSHLNARAYTVLDRVLVMTLCEYDQSTCPLPAQAANVR